MYYERLFNICLNASNLDKGWEIEIRNKIQESLTAHNWQKWKRVFLICPCHKIYRVEAVGLKTPYYT